MRKWYRFEPRAAAAADAPPTAADVFIYDEIGQSFLNDDAVSAKAFIDELALLPDAIRELVVHVNSPGGDVFDAIAIANALRDQRTSKGRQVITSVEGLAASAASLVMMAGSPIRMADNAMMMVHNAVMLTIGDADAHRKTAADLDAIRGPMLTTYRWHSTLTDAELIALLDAETWMDADEAIQHGFATEKVEGLKAAARFEPRALAGLTVPERFKPRVAALVSAPPPVPPASTAADALEVLALCRAGECQELAEDFLRAGAPIADVRAKVDVTRARKAAAASRAAEISALCRAASLSRFAAVLTRSELPMVDVRALLIEVTGLIDRGIEIDGGFGPDDHMPRKGAKDPIDVRAIYRARNGVTFDEATNGPSTVARS